MTEAWPPVPSHVAGPTYEVLSIVYRRRSKYELADQLPHLQRLLGSRLFRPLLLKIRSGPTLHVLCGLIVQCRLELVLRVRCGMLLR